MKPVVFGLLILGVAIGTILVFAQSPFAASAFEYQQYRDYKGLLMEWPYPMLVSGADRFLLVDPGKHGASTNGLAGKTVELKGALIHRGADRMLELLPGTLRSISDAAAAEGRMDLGEITLSGEIVDSKCYLGVMNPGQGKVHRDCAARCISGGIPPIFVTSDGREQFLLVGLEGRALGRDALREFIAEPITIQGERLETGSMQLLKINPRALRHTPDGLRAASKASTFGQ